MKLTETTLKNVDEKLLFEINDSGKYDRDFWTFKNDSKRKYSHLFFNYPAMMVPAMQSELIDIIIKVQKNVKNVVDPFVGSGTTMIESMLRGLNFYGQDINPLAILVCNSKKIPFYKKALDIKIKLLLKKIASDNKSKIDVNFPNRNKWFRKDVQKELCVIRRSIMSEPSKWARQFFWVAFAETIRLSSNSRTSTFKLHIREIEEIEGREINVVKKFTDILINNYDNLNLQRDELKSKGYLSKSTYNGKINIFLKDSSKKIHLMGGKKYDLLISSPPYGDNHTTVTYGQFSYLPLQWINLNDINIKIPINLLEKITSIDSESLGGKKNKSLNAEQLLRKISPTLSSIIDELEIKDIEKKPKVVSFFIDLYESLNNSINSLRKDAYMFWTVGNRSVAGITIPLDIIMREIIEFIGGKFILSLSRDICNKRMASRNNTSNTMTKEEILIMRKT